jgi:hypothetical protein
MYEIFGRPKRPKIFINVPAGLDHKSATQYWLTSKSGWLAYLQACDQYYRKLFVTDDWEPSLFLQAREDLEERELELAHQAVCDELAIRKRALRWEKLKEIGTFVMSLLCSRRP